MPTQITSTNYNNQNCTVTLYSATGNTIPYTNATQISLGTQTIPFTYSSTTVSDEYGVFSCFFSDFNSTCTVSQLTPPDGDGNRYKTIKIGNQIWMSENLRTTKFRDGTPLDNLNQVSNATWAAATAAGVTRYWSIVNNNSGNTQLHGLVYNFFSVTGSTATASPNVTLCPSGWRIPSDADFTTLKTFLGATAASQLKSTTLFSPVNGTNTAGFNGLPSGIREDTGGFRDFGSLGFWWSTSVSGNNAISWYLRNNDNTTFTQNNFGFRVGCVVRCIKN
jgi:uncharacterized protein (TIGR02145 family)